MARIDYFDLAQAQGRAKKTLEKLPPLNLFRMMAHGGDLVDAFTRMGNHLLYFSKLDPVLREIAIIRVGVLSRAAYEIWQHETIARKLGMSEALIRAIHEGPWAAAFDETQRLAMLFVDDVVVNVRASDQTFAPLAKILPAQEMQELTMTIGFYMMVSRFLETFGVDLEDDPKGLTKIPDNRKGADRDAG